MDLATDSNLLANVDGSNYAGNFGSTEGAIVGCTRDYITDNEQMSANAAKGCAGQMIVSKPKVAQKGGKRERKTLNKKYKGKKVMLKGRRMSKRNTRVKKFHKGDKSKTRKGHKDFETWKGSKMYNEKRFKKMFGRKTVRAPFFPFAGGAALMASASEASSPENVNISALGSEVQLAASSNCKMNASGSEGDQKLCGPAVQGPQLIGGRKGRKSRKVHKRHVLKGGYKQYMSNMPLTFGQTVVAHPLSAKNSALASPPPVAPYNHCMKK